MIVWQAFIGVTVHFQGGACLQIADESIESRQSLCHVLAGPLGVSEKTRFWIFSVHMGALATLEPLRNYKMQFFV